MESRVERAVAYHNKGYNCAQAVCCAYCDLFGLDMETAYRVSEGFGFGMGTQQGICGALSGAVLLAGMKNSAGTAVPGTTKGSTYQIDRALSEAFEKAAGAVFCCDIKKPPQMHSCQACIEDASRLIEQMLLRDFV